MKYVVTAAEMRQYDANTMERTGIPGMVLMERAALEVLHVICSRIPYKDRAKQYVLILAGVGNNGGDGLALARMLSEEGFWVEVWGVGNPERATGQWIQQGNILTKYPVEFGGKPRREEYTIIVDALFGVGLTREIEGEYADAIAFCNDREAFKVAVDIPSGISADTGKVLGCAFRADVTVTFDFIKRGVVLYPGCEYAGEVILRHIGISERSFYGQEPGMFLYDEPLSKLLPKRDPGGNKGTFGKVLLIAGSRNMAGAAALSAKAAYRAGAGMVKVLSNLENRGILQEAVLEALFGTYEELMDAAAWADVIGIGPGLGKSKEAEYALKTVIENSDKPLLLDADALNLLAEKGWISDALDSSVRRGRQVILTPHVGELSRLTGHTVLQLKENLPGYAMEYAKKTGTVVVAKDARTYVCMKGSPVFVNKNGNSGMAAAGSGDVLAGCILGLLAQGLKIGTSMEEGSVTGKCPPKKWDAFRAACVGVYAHALAGDSAARIRGEYSCMAWDIAERICVLEQGEA